MKARLINDDSEKTFILIFEKGDEVMKELSKFAKQNELAASRFTAIGAFSDLILGYFDWEKKGYKKIPLQEQVEVLSLVGNITLKGDEPKVHAHVVVGKSDGRAYGGHLLEAHVRPTLEVVITESPKHLQRKIDEETGLSLIDLEGLRDISKSGRVA
jgi:uncharacterized protein